jgi:PIN domain nuclease of toxin-antitoxin system
MHLLLDTHIFIWWLTDNRQLSKKARALIIAADEVFISSASIWEAAIKIALKKLDTDIDTLIAAIPDEGFNELPITTRHTAQLTELPPYHRDPFDRILISQAISEPLRLVTADKMLKPYSELVELV